MRSDLRLAIWIVAAGALMALSVAALRSPEAGGDDPAELRRRLDAETARADRLERELAALRRAPAAEIEGTTAATPRPQSAGSVRELMARGETGPALELIGAHRLVEEVPTLVALLSDAAFGREAARMLGDLGDSRAIEPLAAAYGAGDWSMKRETSLALRSLGRPEYVEHFVSELSAQALSDADGELRYEGVRELARLNDPMALPALRAALADSNSRVRAAAARQVGMQGDASHLPDLEALAADRSEKVRQAAQKAVAWIHDPSLRQEAMDVIIVDSVTALGTISLILDATR
jgi:hypothetical protein